MTPKAVYLEAGRMLAEGESDFSCLAIEGAENPSGFPGLSHLFLAAEYREVFFPEGDSFAFCDAVEAFAEESSTKEVRNLRVLMTTLMAVSWKDFQ